MSKAKYLCDEQVLNFIKLGGKKIRIYDAAGNHTLSIVACGDTSLDVSPTDPFYGSGYDLYTAAGEHLWCGLQVKEIVLLTLAAAEWNMLFA
jgi:hypothetical protein